MMNFLGITLGRGVASIFAGVCFFFSSFFFSFSAFSASACYIHLALSPSNQALLRYSSAAPSS
jgi:hypothetical protein